MEDWDADQRRRAATAPRVRPILVLLVFLLLAVHAVVIGWSLHRNHPQNPYAAPADPEASARTAAAVEMLFGPGPLRAADPDALTMTAGRTATLENKNTEVRVTPGRISAGTAACAPGPLLTVPVNVSVQRGSAALPLAEFALVQLDGSVAYPVESCSAGFTEGAEERTVVFAVSQPGLLALGPDPEHPIVRWQLM
ncbi:hypothetical protein [Actinoplanes solisilvae]|uniref:hypothetical protein n=1 Tax=Actinoplanes solisilvae TaxID=2486853 RepID=UPI000FD8BE31|nr:hypothetical protein [Actinoplanes solisilvae]